MNPPVEALVQNGRPTERTDRKFRATLADAASRASGCCVRLAWNALLFATVAFFVSGLLGRAGEGIAVWMFFLGPALIGTVVILFFSDRFREMVFRFTWWKAFFVAAWWFIPRDTHVDGVYMSPFMAVVYLIRDLF